MRIIRLVSLLIYLRPLTQSTIQYYQKSEINGSKGTTLAWLRGHWFKSLMIAIAIHKILYVKHGLTWANCT